MVGLLRKSIYWGICMSLPFQVETRISRPVLFAVVEGHEILRHTQSQMRYEEEPKVDYRIGWKIWAAVFALSLSNCSAMISNTVSCPFPYTHSQRANR